MRAVVKICAIVVLWWIIAALVVFVVPLALVVVAIRMAIRHELMEALPR